MLSAIVIVSNTRPIFHVFYIIQSNNSHFIKWNAESKAMYLLVDSNYVLNPFSEEGEIGSYGLLEAYGLISTS